MSPEPSGVRVFGVFRNESLRIPYFFEYYRSLGVTEFVVVDNDSTDGTRDWLLQQTDTHVYEGVGSFLKARFGYRWLAQLLEIYGRGRWCIIADADELFTFPFCETRSVNDLVSFLEAQGDSALFALLLDMYANSPFDEVRYDGGMDPLEVCSYFDPDSHYLWKSADFESRESSVGEYPHFYRGGMRHRVFGVAPCLNKIPLLRYGSGVRLHPGAHFIEGARISRLRGVVLHFKFFRDFPGRVFQEMERKEHYNQGEQYKYYARALRANPQLNPYCERSQQYLNSLQFVSLQLMRHPREWKEWR